MLYCILIPIFLFSERISILQITFEQIITVKLMDISGPSSSNSGDQQQIASASEANTEIQWRFSQIKGNIETEDAPTDGFLPF